MSDANRLKNTNLKDFSLLADQLSAWFTLAVGVPEFTPLIYFHKSLESVSSKGEETCSTN